jgi:hypothetical protein
MAWLAPLEAPFGRVIDDLAAFAEAFAPLKSKMPSRQAVTLAIKLSAHRIRIIPVHSSCWTKE